MHEVVVLVRGFAEATPNARLRCGATITLIKGEPNVLVDTGAPEQRQELLDALATYGISPSDIEWVVLTHGHLDHVGNNNLFPQATFVLDSDVARNGEYWMHEFDRAPLLIEPTDGSPPIRVIPTRGHTNHDLTVLVDTPDGRVAIAGDLFEHDGDWVDNAWHRYSSDQVVHQRSRDAVLAVADHIVPGHGPMFRVQKSA